VLPETIACGICTLRPWQLSDRDALIANADSREVWRNLWDTFPRPYSASDADEFLAEYAQPRSREGFWAVDVEGEAIGSLSLMRGTDVERLGAEIGYWIGEKHWGRGIVSRAVKVVTDVAFEQTDLMRLFAPVYCWNKPSMRVLEKAGYLREGVLTRSAFKDGMLIDRVLFARTREGDMPYVPAA
jgi:ribosomal-protein-alanine N-acetyltransferase